MDKKDNASQFMRVVMKIKKMRTGFLHRMQVAIFVNLKAIVIIIIIIIWWHALDQDSHLQDGVVAFSFKFVWLKIFAIDNSMSCGWHRHISFCLVQKSFNKWSEMLQFRQTDYLPGVCWKVCCHRALPGTSLIVSCLDFVPSLLIQSCDLFTAVMQNSVLLL